MNLRNGSDHKEKPFALRLKPAQLEVISDPDTIKEAIEDEVSSSSSRDDNGVESKMVELAKPELRFEVSFIPDKSKLICRLGWEDDS